MVEPNAAALPGVASLLEHLNTFLGTGYAAADLAYAFFSIPVRKAHEKSCFQGSRSAVSYHWAMYINSPTLYHNLVLKDFHHLSLPSDITLVHYIDDLTLIGPSEQGVATNLDLLVRYCVSEGGKQNSGAPILMISRGTVVWGNVKISLLR